MRVYGWVLGLLRSVAAFVLSAVWAAAGRITSTRRDGRGRRG
jgi:uncharacterized membrane protein (DUF485 family)